MSRSVTKVPHPIGVEFSKLYTDYAIYQVFGIKLGINLNTTGKP